MSIDWGDIAATLMQELGCDDLPPMDPYEKFAVLVLWLAHRDRSSEVVVEDANASGMVPIRYFIDGACYEMSLFPAHVRRHLTRAVIDMAGLIRGTAFPCQGHIDIQVSPKVRLQWDVSLASAEDPIHFARARK